MSVRANRGTHSPCMPPSLRPEAPPVSQRNVGNLSSAALVTVRYRDARPFVARPQEPPRAPPHGKPHPGASNFRASRGAIKKPQSTAFPLNNFERTSSNHGVSSFPIKRFSTAQNTHANTRTTFEEGKEASHTHTHTAKVPLSTASAPL